MENTQPAVEPKTKAPRSTLTVGEMFKLVNFVHAEYTKSELTDVEFAKKAAEFLGIAKINANNVATAREVHGLLSNRDKARDERKSRVPMVTMATQELLDRYDQRILSLEKQVRKLFAGITTEQGPSDLQVLALWRKCNEENTTSGFETLLVKFSRALIAGDWK